MGNYAYFVGCGGRERNGETDGPELEAKNDVPLLWLAAFDVEDLLVRRRAGERPEVALCTPAVAGLERLRRRREAVLRLVGERFDALYDAWIEHVARSYPRSLLLRTWIEEEEEEEQQQDVEFVLRGPLTALAAADRGEAIPRAEFDRVDILHGIDPDEPAAEGALRRRAILAGWSVPQAGETWHWPPPPTGEEVGRVDGRRGSNVVPAIPDDLALEELGVLLARRFVAAVPEVWACAVPQAALYAVWARGEFERVYEVARLREFRAPMLAWYAGMDPEPRAPRVVRAAVQALAAAASAEQLLSVVALMPCVEPEVVRRARRVAKAGSRIVLALRLDAAPVADGAERPLDDPHAGGEVAAVLRALKALRGMFQAKRPRGLADAFASLLGELERFDSSQAPALQASAAVWLADRGRREEAEVALRRALDVPILLSTIQPAMLPAIRRLGAWDRVEVDRHLAAPYLLDAAFMAGRDGEDAVRRLLSGIADSALRAAAAGCAALGAGEALAAVQAALGGEWREDARGCEPVDSELAWAIRFGRAVVGHSPREDVDGLVGAAFAEAVEAARSFVARIEGALGDGAPDLAQAQALLREVAPGEGDLDCLLRVDAHPRVLECFAPVFAAIDPAGAAGVCAGLRAALAALSAP